jgi:hypothetical protein
MASLTRYCGISSPKGAQHQKNRTGRDPSTSLDDSHGQHFFFSHSFLSPSLPGSHFASHSPTTDRQHLKTANSSSYAYTNASSRQGVWNPLLATTSSS